MYDHLKIEWSKVYEFACSLEHATAPEVTEALAGFLNHPSTCPRGNTIPDEHGVFAPLKGRVISELKPGESATVLAVSATDTEVLKYLQDKNILPGQELKFIEAAPFQGPLTVSVNGKEVALGLSLVDYVIVK